jgi:hypothetical protein
MVSLILYAFPTLGGISHSSVLVPVTATITVTQASPEIPSHSISTLNP